MERTYACSTKEIDNALFTLIENQVEYEYNNDDDIAEFIGNMNDMDYEDMLDKILDEIYNPLIEELNKKVADYLIKLSS